MDIEIEINEALIEEVKKYLDEFYDPDKWINKIKNSKPEFTTLYQKDLSIEYSKNYEYEKDDDEEVDEDILDDLDLSFKELLFKFIEEKDINEIDCYKNANLDRRLFSKIRNDEDYRPKKTTVFALIIGLRLNLDEADKLLISAGYIISHSLKFDTIMEYVIKKGIYDITKVNEILYRFECEPLGAK